MLNGVEGTVKLHWSPDWVIEKLWLNGVLDVDDVPVTTRLAIRCGELAFSLMFGAAVSPAVQFPEFELPASVSHAGLSSETELVHVNGDAVILIPALPPEKPIGKLPVAAAL
jgi:hypothetical protein